MSCHSPELEEIVRNRQFNVDLYSDFTLCSIVMNFKYVGAHPQHVYAYFCPKMRFYKRPPYQK